MTRLLRKLISDPRHWRARATEMRAVAAQVTDPKVKATTSGAADGYDKLARTNSGEPAAIERDLP
jgi:hypothetical protein